MTMKNKVLTAGSLALVLACISTAFTQTAPRMGDANAKAAPESAPAAPPPTKIPPAADFRHQFVEVAKTIRPAVVTVTSTSTVEVGRGSPFEGNPFEFFFRGQRPEGKQRRQGMGSGVIVDARGYILTNNHVVADADEIKVVLQNDHELPAEIVGADPKTDVAVIKVKLDERTKAAGLKVAQLGDSDGLEVGEWVMAVGAPFGLTQTVSAGIVSAVGRGNVGIADYEDFIQTDAAINPGNSGGPLVNLDGKLIGINTAIASQSGGNNGVGFAIPVNMAKSVMDQLIKHGEVVRGYLGVFIAPLTDELAASFGYKDQNGGVLVQDVSPDGPAAKAGLKAGDILLQRDGKPIRDVATFRNGISETSPGTQVGLTVWRDGKRMNLNAKLEELPNDGKAKKGKPHNENTGRGLGLTDPNEELRQRFELGNARGGLVAGVKPDSAAARAGLQPGDLITQVGKEEVKNANEVQRAISAADASKPLRLRVVRQGHGMFVILPPSK
jgi:serine protease Do